jgi:hypothetical protein
MSKSFWDHPVETIEKALDIRKRIESLQRSLNEMLGGDAQLPLPFFMVRDGSDLKRSAAKARKAKKKAAAKVEKAKRVASKASGKKTAAAQKARWTKQKKFPHTGAGIE